MLTGAGVSAESGVPTFRDAQTGLWARFRPEDLATEQAFRRNPGRVWDWYAERREKLLGVQPNAGHHALAAFARRAPGRLTLITQNVDGLHQLAGSEGVLCLHGRLADDRWLDHPRPCCDLARAVPDRPPRCAGCGNLVRPGVVWFGEALPTQALDAAQQAVQACDVMLVVGTAGAVYPAAGLAHQARQAGARVVVLNVGRASSTALPMPCCAGRRRSCCLHCWTFHSISQSIEYAKAKRRQYDPYGKRSRQSNRLIEKWNQTQPSAPSNAPALSSHSRWMRVRHTSSVVTAESSHSGQSRAGSPWALPSHPGPLPVSARSPVAPCLA
ncbi:NAD-dependent protein deacetylase [Alicycliphilus sp. B1]|nr:NAD-dependent protein deacetylase [Alicycliphilus sp. B1]